MLVSTNESVSINVTGCKIDKSDTENLLVIKFDKKLSFDGHNIIGIKAKGRVSKRVFQENKACQIFRKTNISYPLIRTRTFAYQGVRNVTFWGTFAFVLNKRSLTRYLF